MKISKNINESKPLVSIITVVFNGEKYLEETIQSIIRQTYGNIEYIIIDGGSTDRTIDILKQYDAHLAYWMSEKDDGIYDAMNKGISRSSGDIIGLVNADDILLNDSVEKIALMFSVQPELMFTYGSLYLMNENSEIVSTVDSLGTTNWKYRLFRHMPFLHPTMFIRRAVYSQVGLYDTSYRLSADYDFILRLLRYHFKSQKLDFITGCFRIGGRSGGYESYIENHQILLKHGVNHFLVYLNSSILLLKFFFRKLFS